MPTKASDQGWTFLRNGRKVRKDCPCLMAGGDIDELVSVLGAALAALAQRRAMARVSSTLEDAQKALLAAGCAFSCPKPIRGKKPFSLSRDIRALERSLELLDYDLPRLTGFVVPGGSPAGAWLHVARSVCRRAERNVAALAGREPVPEGLLAFLNRLSQWLFAAARWVNARKQRPEPLWR